MLCIPNIADCGGLMIGVESIDPKTPPFVMVKVPPVISSGVILPSLALIANLLMSDSISWSSIPSAFRTTGTMSPLGDETAMPISAYSCKIISLSPICALTVGKSFKDSVTALVKKDIKPKLTPNFSANASLYFFLRSIMGFISTSLNVVSIAVSFLTATNL